MSIFEFLTVAVSIILALGLSRLISSIPYVFDPQKRDWLHALFLVLLIIGHLVLWWRVWLLNVVSSWNFLQFVILIGSPLSLYLTTTALVSSTPDRISDWKLYFTDRSQWVLSALTVAIFFGLLRSYFIMGTTPEWWSFSALAFFGGGALTKRREVHIGVALISFVYVVLLLSRNFTAA
jgi:hypothetical protein